MVSSAMVAITLPVSAQVNPLSAACEKVLKKLEVEPLSPWGPCGPVGPVGPGSPEFSVAEVPPNPLTFRMLSFCLLLLSHPV